MLERDQDEKDWSDVTLSRVCKTIYRYPTFYGFDHFPDGVPIIRGEHLKGGQINLDGTEPARVSKDVAFAYPKTILEIGDIVVSVRGTIGNFAVVDTENAGSQISPNLIRLQPNKALCDPDYFYFVFSSKIKALVQKASQSQALPALGASEIKALRFSLPPINMQRRIAEILRTWDVAIRKLEALRIAGEKQYFGLADDLIFGRRRNIGKRRNWRHRRLGDVTREVMARNVGGRLGRDAVMGVTKANGIVPMRDQTIGANLSRYKVLPPLGFAYNPMRINIGSIALSRLDSDVLVSPDYVLFTCQKGKLSPDYLEHLRKTHFWSHHINAGGAGSVRLRIYYDDFAALNLPLPEYDEQLAIVEVLDAARRQIDLTEAEIDLLSRQKRGLMQKLLTGEWRVQAEER